MKFFFSDYSAQPEKLLCDSKNGLYVFSHCYFVTAVTSWVGAFGKCASESIGGYQGQVARVYDTGAVFENVLAFLFDKACNATMQYHGMYVIPRRGTVNRKKFGQFEVRTGPQGTRCPPMLHMSRRVYSSTQQPCRLTLSGGNALLLGLFTI